MARSAARRGCSHSDTADPLLLIAALSTVWVLANVYESDLTDLHLDAPVAGSVTAYPQRTIQVRIASINPTVDLHSTGALSGAQH